MLVRIAGAVAAIAITTLPAAAWDRWSLPRPSNPPGQVDPQVRPYGPGAYAENGVVVYVPPNCYVSREQVWSNGALVWRPIKTCPSPGYR